jgi:hypothetical protein
MRRDVLIRRRFAGQPERASVVSRQAWVAGPVSSPAAGEVAGSSVVAIRLVAVVRTVPARAGGAAGRRIGQGTAVIGRDLCPLPSRDAPGSSVSR